jgi:mRNA interferase MazF
LIVQADDYRHTASVAVCLITTDKTDAQGLREPVQPSRANGLLHPSHIMVDKIMAVSRHRLGQRVGALSSGDLARVDRALLVFLGLAG